MSLAKQRFIKARNFFMWILGIITLFDTLVSGFLTMKVETTKEGKWKFIWDANANSEITMLVSVVGLVVVIAFVLFEILSRFTPPSLTEDFKERQLFYFLACYGVIRIFISNIVVLMDEFVKADLTSQITLLINIVTALFIFIYFRKKLSLIGINRPNSYKRLILGIPLGYIVIIIFVNGVVGQLIQPLLPVEFFSSRESFIREVADSNWILTFISVAIMAPITEELVYRGVFQTYLIKRLGAFFGVLLSSLAFAVMHFDPALLLLLTSMGIVFGISKLYTNCIWLPIILHMINNTVVFLIGGS